MPRTTTPLALLVLMAGSALAQNPFQNGQEFDDVQNRQGDASPAAGPSGVNNYTNQDEQINVDPDTGVLRVLRTDQKVLINDFITATYPVQQAHPRELRDVMRVVCGIEGGRAEIIRDEEAGESFVQVICPKFMLPFLDEAIRSLDVDWLAQAQDGSVTDNYVTRFRPAASLDAIASNYAGEGSSQLDAVLNTIVRRDEPLRVAMYMEACELFDQAPPQARLSFRIYEVDTSNDLSIGVDWIAWKNGPGRSLFDLVLGGQESHHRYDNASGHFDPNLGALTLVSDGTGQLHAEASQILLSANYLLTSAFLDFLRVKGKARVLAQPEVFAFSGRSATWTSADQVLAFETTPDATVGANGIEPVRLNNVFAVADPDDPPPFAIPQDTRSDFATHNRFLNHRVRAELGITLNVLPVVGTESSEVEIELISSDLAGQTPQGTPIITNRRLVTKLRLVDGQPVVLGGLTREEDVDASNMAPWLGDIPVLGYLFGQENRSARRKELIITVVPHFYQGAPQDVEEAEWLDTIAMATGETAIEMPPRNCFGFDKWMFRGIEPE